MVGAASRIRSYTRLISHRKFMRDQKTQDAVVRNLEIIGEAAKGLPASFRNAHPQVPWGQLAGMRDRLIHGYAGVNYDIVWDIIEQDLPGLVTELKKLLRE